MKPWWNKALWILWPSFIAGAAGTALFFSMVDPVDLRFVGPLELGRKAGYTIGFFFFWALAAGSSWVSCFLRGRAERTDAAS